MSNPLFGQTNIMQKFNMLRNEVNRIRQNPDQLGQLLYDNKRISKEQLSEINQYNGNFSEIGKYLTSNGIMSQNDATQFYNSMK